jgi:ABC-type polar amino acid transport system ATPase subunit
MLTARGIKKAYDGNKVLHGIDLTVNAGEITAIIGPSGGGKSTLLRAVSLLDPPDAGTVDIDGYEYTFPKRAQNGFRPPWPSVTVVFQQLFLWPHLTLRRNITLPLEKRRVNLNGNRAPCPPDIDDLLDLFELKEHAHRFPNEVSLGQRQRAAFIRAVALQPKYLLLDEITSALDVEHVSRILEYLKTLRQQGTGVLLVTHLIGFAKGAADQVIFMERGHLVASGGSTLLTAPTNERLVKFLSLVETAL